jgi:hypothetical protein
MVLAASRRLAGWFIYPGMAAIGFRVLAQQTWMVHLSVSQ